MSADVFALERGDVPLLVSVPHAGPDGDPFVDRLYRPLRELDATLLVARCARGAADLDREPPPEPALGELWQPYHDALQAELRRMRAAHGYAILLDAHAARDPAQPDLTLGTGGGRSCDPRAVEEALRALRSSGYGCAVDGPVNPGYITQRYGSPAHEVHALRLLPHRRTYLDEATPPGYDPRKAARVGAVVLRLADALLSWGKTAHPARQNVLE